MKYISQINENLICCICQYPFTNPKTISPCGHSFCESCLFTCLKSSSECPLDRIPITEIKSANLIIHNLVEELIVSCCRDECTWTGQRALLESHLQQLCLFQVISCTNVDCQERILRMNIQEHLNSCPFTLLECPNCLEREIRKKLHSLEDCPSSLYTCSDCFQSMYISEKDSHALKCPECQVECEWKEFGCLWSEKRSQLTLHLSEDCKYEPFKEVFTNLISQIQTLKRELESTRQVNVESTERMTCLEQENQRQIHVNGELYARVGELEMHWVQSRNEVERIKSIICGVNQQLNNLLCFSSFQNQEVKSTNGSTTNLKECNESFDGKL